MFWLSYNRQNAKLTKKVLPEPSNDEGTSFCLEYYRKHNLLDGVARQRQGQIMFMLDHACLPHVYSATFSVHKDPYARKKIYDTTMSRDSDKVDLMTC